MPERRPRTWGYWTQAKLRILADYLAAFATASKGQPERVYLDGFAGEEFGTDRLTGERFEGSARIALDVPNPAFTRYLFFEKPALAAQLESRLSEEYPGRSISVYAGNCNETVPRALADLRGVRWAPTFVFLDPDGMELAWKTLAALADHKRGYRPMGSAKPEYKVEMWMLFPSQGLIRTLGLQAPLGDRDASRATLLFGNESWRPIHDLRRRNMIDGADARDEYVNLMRWRLQNDLEYRWTHPLEVKNLRGGPLYHMILATDSKAGTRIMSDLYGKAAKEIPQMRQEILERIRQPGQGKLFEPSEALPKHVYEYTPPHEPPT